MTPPSPGPNRRTGPHAADVGPAVVLQVLRRDVALEDVLEVLVEAEVDVEKCAMSTTLSTISRQLEPSTHDAVPLPVGPLVGEHLRQARNRDVVRRRVALGIVPHEELLFSCSVIHERVRCDRRHSTGIRDVVCTCRCRPNASRGTGRRPSRLDLTLAEVTAHVPAVRVENVELVLAVREDDQFGAERLDRVRLFPSRNSLSRPMQCQPRAKRVLRSSHIDLTNLRHQYLTSLLAVARTRYRTSTDFARFQCL